MDTLNRRLFALSTLGASLLLLGGCAQIGSLSGSVWGKAKHITQTATSQVTDFLRPVSSQIAVFEGKNNDIDPIETDYIQQFTIPTLEQNSPIIQHAMIHTIEEGVHVYRPGGTKSHIILLPNTPLIDPAFSHGVKTPKTEFPDLRPAYDILDTSNRVMEEEHNSGLLDELAGPLPKAPEPDFSYVKIGGGSDMVDWQTCQDNVGAFAIPGAHQFQINPAFDNCMRGKGYLPESEAIKLLETQDQH